MRSKLSSKAKMYLFLLACRNKESASESTRNAWNLVAFDVAYLPCGCRFYEVRRIARKHGLSNVWSTENLRWIARKDKFSVSE